MAMDPEKWSAYMREYRRRRRLNGHQPLGRREYASEKAHEACDRRIAELERQLAEARAALPF